MTNESEPKLPIFLWWVMWAALLGGVFVMYVVTGTATAPSDETSPVWMVGLIPFCVSVVVRWMVLPRFERPEQAFPWFVIALATGEMTCMTGMFAFPAHKVELLALGFLAMLQLAPYFASRYYEPKN